MALIAPLSSIAKPQNFKVTSQAVMGKTMSIKSSDDVVFKTVASADGAGGLAATGAAMFLTLAAIVSTAILAAKRTKAKSLKQRFENVFGEHSAKGKILKALPKEPGSNISDILAIDEAAGKQYKVIFNKDNKALKEVIEYDSETQNIIKETSYQLDGKTIDTVIEYNSETGTRLKSTTFFSDGKTPEHVSNYSLMTGHRTKTFYYQKNGKTLSKLADYDIETGFLVRAMHYQSDGKTLKQLDCYGKKNNILIKTTSYQPDGETLERIVVFDPCTRNPLKVIYYQPNGKNYRQVLEYNAKTGLIKKEIFFQKDGITFKEVVDYEKEERFFYNPDGSVNHIEKINNKP